MEKLSNIPNERNLISHSLRFEGESPRRHVIAVLEYPDCQREFDGKNWKVTKDYRKQPERNIFMPVQLLDDPLAGKDM